MRKSFWLLSAFGAIMLCTSLGWGQGACITSQVLTSKASFSNLASVVPNATINVSPGPIYTDQTLSTVLSTSPVATADSNGNFQVCAAPGTQTLTISGGNISTLIVKWTFAVQPASSTTWTGLQTFNGPVVFNVAPTFNAGINANSPIVQVTIAVIGQNAALGVTTLVTPSVLTQYRVSWNAVVDRAASTSSTLGPLTLAWNDAGNTPFNTAMYALQPGTATPLLTTNANTGGTAMFGISALITDAPGIPLTYSFGYASAGVTTMLYEFNLKLESM